MHSSLFLGVARRSAGRLSFGLVLVSFMAVGCENLRQTEAPRSIGQAASLDVLDAHLKDVNFYAPEPTISESAWSEFSRAVISRGTPETELPGMRAVISHDLRRRVYQAAGAATFLNVPIDFDKHKDDGELQILVTVNSLAFAKRASQASKGGGLSSLKIFGGSKDEKMTEGISAKIDLTLVRNGAIQTSVDAEGYGSVTTSQEDEREGGAGDTGGSVLGDDAVTKAATSATFATDEGRQASQDFSLSAAVNKAAGEAMAAGLPVVWAKFADRLGLSDAAAPADQ